MIPELFKKQNGKKALSTYSPIYIRLNLVDPNETN